MATTTLSDLSLRLLDVVRSGAPDTCLLVEVTAYDASEQTADVRLCVQVPEVDPATGDIVGLVAPVLRGRPVMWPSGGGASLVWGLSAGDLALGLIRSRSHDEVDSGTAVPVTPASTRRGNLSDLVVVPLIGGGASPLGASAYRSDGQPVLVPGGAGDALHVGAATASLRLVIEDVLRPYLSDLKLWADTHTHPTPAGASSAPTTPSPAVPASASLASGRIKVDT